MHTPDSRKVAGAYAAFLAEGVHFKLERTSCQQSLKYISLYNTEGAPFSTEKKETYFCLIKIRNIILGIGNSKPGGSNSELVRQK